MYDYGDDTLRAAQVARTEQSRNDGRCRLLDQFAEFGISAIAAFAPFQDEEQAVLGEEVGPGGVERVGLRGITAAGGDGEAKLGGFVAFWDRSGSGVEFG